MDLGEIEQLRGELAAFVAEVFASVSRKDTRGWGDCYLRVLMLDGRRKSIQPMAERLPDGDMQALQQFVNQSPWDPRQVLRAVAVKTVPVVDPVVWVIDDVSFPKDGRMSVGVARQWSSPRPCFTAPDSPPQPNEVLLGVRQRCSPAVPLSNS